MSASFTVLTISKTCLCTCSSITKVIYKFMTKSCFKYYSTYGTLVRTVTCCTIFKGVLMTQCSYGCFFLIITSTTCCCFNTVGYTTRGESNNCRKIVIFHRNSCCITMITLCTVMCHSTILCTCCFHSYLFSIFEMSCRICVTINIFMSAIFALACMCCITT